MRNLRTSRTTTAVLAALTSAATAACGGSARRGPETAPQPTATAELEAIYRTRTDSALMRFTEADVHFMTGMISHHGQALVMAGLAPSHGASPQLLTLTSRIINAQTDEIATMQGWLRDRGKPVPEVEVDGTTLLIDGSPDNVMQMAGMLSPEQMRDLDQARGTEFDRLFLSYMIQHHSGAITMVDELFSTDGAAQGMLAFKLASDIQVDQATEIERMKLMLEALPDTGRYR
ncbi:MAG: DUF305 domain-containing protein [Gemmatimonadales bacterium]